MKKICIITPDYIASSPRVIKEADALSAAGFDVRVVFSQGNIEYMRGFDEGLLKDKPWLSDIVGWSPFRKGEQLLYWKSKLRQQFAKKTFFVNTVNTASCAQSRVYKELVLRAASIRADLYIGHYPAGLAVAAVAAKANGARFSYDVADFHIQEGASDKEGMRQKQMIRLIESSYLPDCVYVSCVSLPVADEMVKYYNIKRPVIMHNVFPWAERNKFDGLIKDRKSQGLSLYWYSQVIGFDRGIQDAVRAAAIVKDNIQIHLRGYLSKATKRKFVCLAKECGMSNAIYYHAPVAPGELLSRASEHDLGLALEQSVDLSRQLTVTNKFFFYLLAGLGLLITDTPGQKMIFSSCPDTGFIYQAGDCQALAGYIKRFIAEPGLLEACKQASLRAAKDKWNWEIESPRLIDAVSRAVI